MKFLTQHFLNKKTISDDDSNANLNFNRSYFNRSNEGISIDYSNSPKNINRKSKKLEEVIEEILNKNSSSSSNSSINVSINTKNSKKSIKKALFNSDLSPISAINKPKKINKNVIKNNYVNEEDKKEIIKKASSEIQPLSLY